MAITFGFTIAMVTSSAWIAAMLSVGVSAAFSDCPAEGSSSISNQRADDTEKGMDDCLNVIICRGNQLCVARRWISGQNINVIFMVKFCKYGDLEDRMVEQ